MQRDYKLHWLLVGEVQVGDICLTLDITGEPHRSAQKAFNELEDLQRADPATLDEEVVANLQQADRFLIRGEITVPTHRHPVVILQATGNGRGLAHVCEWIEPEYLQHLLTGEPYSPPRQPAGITGGIIGR